MTRMIQYISVLNIYHTGGRALNHVADHASVLEMQIPFFGCCSIRPSSVFVSVSHRATLIGHLGAEKHAVNTTLL